MSPDEYRSQLLAVAQSFVAAVLVWLRFLPANPTDRQWAEFVDLIYPEMMRARRRTFELSRDYYHGMRPPADDPMPEIFERRYPRSVLDEVLTETVRSRLEGEEADLDRDLIQREAVAALERHAMAAGRDAVTDSTTSDPAAIGYARVPSGEETCGFCLMLVSRGVVYKSARSAGATEPYHNRCDCVVVPVFDADDWPGRDRYLEAEALYKRARRLYPDEPALRAVRRLLEEEASA